VVEAVRKSLSLSMEIQRRGYGGRGPGRMRELGVMLTITVKMLAVATDEGTGKETDGEGGCKDWKIRCQGLRDLAERGATCA
jgi:hypothetical protein